MSHGAGGADADVGALPDEGAAGTGAGAEGREEFLRITEIFHSIQGESTWAGSPCTFVRLTGCPLRCVWCDTEYAFHGGSRMTFSEILAAVEGFGCELVQITGGEPLAHPGAFRLAEQLVADGRTVLVETSGAFDVQGLPPEVHVIMDLKCPGSGESHRNLWSNLDHLDGRDEVKFVVADRADYEWARRVIRERDLSGRVREKSLGAILVSPVWEAQSEGRSPEGGQPFLEALASWILEDGLPVRMQLQMHKAIWGPTKAGV